jgi:antirestriction protein ArdC
MSTDTYQLITDRIIAKLEAGTIPWKHYTTIKASEGAPRNYCSGRQYNGINYFLLGMMGYSSPHWLTFNQAKDQGGMVRKGQKSMPIVYWNFSEREDKKTGENKSIPFLKYFNVFNAEQIDGIDARIPKPSDGRETNANELAEQIIATMPNRPVIKTGEFAAASYSPSADIVRMTAQKFCVSDSAYYSTLLHELVHSTGHHSRLNRPLGDSFGSTGYSREELIAEMGAAFLCAECGIAQETEDNAASYVASWLRVLKNDPKAVVTAAGKAQKASDFILNKNGSIAASDANAISQKGQNTKL